MLYVEIFWRLRFEVGHALLCFDILTGKFRVVHDCSENHWTFQAFVIFSVVDETCSILLGQGVGSKGM